MGCHQSRQITRIQLVFCLLQQKLLLPFQRVKRFGGKKKAPTTCKWESILKVLLITQYLLPFLSTVERFQKVSERQVCIMTRTLAVLQWRGTDINLMTSKENCHTDLFFMVLGPTTFFTSVGSAKGTHRQSRPEYSKHSEFLTKLFPLLSQELPIFNQYIPDRKHSKESIPDGPVTALSTSATSLRQYLESHTMCHYVHCE